MKKLIRLCAIAASLPCPQARAITDDDLSEAALSTDTVKSDETAEMDETQAYIQESDEDLAGFVQDYIKKDTVLKGAVFLEEPTSGRILKLNLEAVAKKSSDGPGNSKIVEAVFRDASGKKRAVLFYIQSVGFGGIDIFKIEFRKEEKTGKSAKVKNNL